jgi:hypothetical protein
MKISVELSLAEVFALSEFLHGAKCGADAPAFADPSIAPVIVPLKSGLDILTAQLKDALHQARVLA